MKDTVLSFVRTWVPIVIGSFLTWLGDTTGIILEGDAEGGLVTFVTALVIAVYYLLARALENWNPFFGFLLGSTKQPVYAPGKMVNHMAEVRDRESGQVSLWTIAMILVVAILVVLLIRLV